mgnify:CR=1 FL=1|jgi:hypothetical protein
METIKKDSSKLARCENCLGQFPEHEIRYFLCEECNGNNGHCYRCEDKDNKIMDLEKGYKVMSKLYELSHDKAEGEIK